MEPFPSGPYINPYTPAMHDAGMDTGLGLSAHYLFIPLTSLQSGALALNQFNLLTCKSDAILYEAFCAAAMRRADRLFDDKLVSRLTVTIMPDEHDSIVGHLYTLYENDQTMAAYTEFLQNGPPAQGDELKVVAAGPIGGPLMDLEAKEDDGSSSSSSSDSDSEAGEGRRRSRAGAAPRPRKSGGINNPELRVANYDLGQYFHKLCSAVPPTFFLHLRRLVKEGGGADWTAAWPNLIGSKYSSSGLAGARDVWQNAVDWYLSRSRGAAETAKSTAPTLGRTEHPFHPSRVFTLENALHRYRRCRSYIYDPLTRIKYPTVTAFMAARPMTSECYALWPEYTFAIREKLLVPKHMEHTCMPVYYDLANMVEEFQTPAYRSFRRQHYQYATDVPEETIQRLYLTQCANQTPPAYKNMEQFFSHYERLAGRRTMSRARLFAAAARDLPALLRPTVPEGNATRAFITWAEEFLDENDGHFSLWLSPLEEYVNQNMGAMATFVGVVTQWLSVTCRVADTQATILALGLMAISSAAKPRSKETLQPAMLLTGPPGKGKSFALFCALAMFVVPNVVQAVGHVSALSHFRKENNRFYIQAKDELDAEDLDVSDDVTNAYKQMQAVLYKSGMSVSSKATSRKMQQTNTEMVALHNTIGPDGTRQTIETKSTAHGIMMGGSNIPQSLMALAAADRTICKECPAMDASAALDQIVASMIQRQSTPMRETKSHLETYLHRLHYLYFRYNLYVSAKVLMGPDEAHFGSRMRVLTDELTRMGVPDAAAPRKMFKLLPAASVLAFQQALTLCFDWGIGGPDRGRPFRDSDLTLLEPLYVINDQITVFVAELYPIFLPEIMLAILQGIRRLFYEPSATVPGAEVLRKEVRPAPENGYRRLANFFRNTGRREQFVTDGYKTTLCSYLAKHLQTEQKVPYDERAMFCTCASLLTDIVATQPHGRQMVYVPGWRVDTGNNSDPTSEHGPDMMWDLIIHEKLLGSAELDENFMFHALCKTLNQEEKSRMVLRGVQQPHQRHLFATGHLQAKFGAIDFIATAKYQKDLADWSANEAKIIENRAAMEDRLKTAGQWTPEQIAKKLHDTFASQHYPIPQPPQPVSKTWVYPDANYMPADTRKRLREGHIGPLDVQAFDESSQSSTPQAEILPNMDEALAARRLQALGIADPDGTHFARPVNLQRCIQAYAHAAWSIDAVKTTPTVQMVHSVLLKFCAMFVVYDLHQALLEPPSELHMARLLRAGGLGAPVWGEVLHQAYYEWVVPYAEQLDALHVTLTAWIAQPHLQPLGDVWSQRFQRLVDATVGPSRSMGVAGTAPAVPRPRSAAAMAAAQVLLASQANRGPGPTARVTSDNTTSAASAASSSMDEDSRPPPLETIESAVDEAADAAELSDSSLDEPEPHTKRPRPVSIRERFAFLRAVDAMHIDVPLDRASQPPLLGGPSAVGDMEM